jgi:hypothetical protein
VQLANVRIHPDRNLAGNRPFTGVLQGEEPMNGVIYLVGLIVVVMFILSFLGLR